MTGSLTLDITYGIDVRSVNDPLIVNAEKALDSLKEFGNAGASLGMNKSSFCPACSDLSLLPADYIPIRRYYYLSASHMS